MRSELLRQFGKMTTASATVKSESNGLLKHTLTATDVQVTCDIFTHAEVVGGLFTLAICMCTAVKES